MMEFELKSLAGASIVTEATETKNHDGSTDAKAMVFNRKAQPWHGSNSRLTMSEEAPGLDPHKSSLLHGKFDSVEVDVHMPRSNLYDTPPEAGIRREYETEDMSSGKVRSQSVEQKIKPELEGTVNTNSGELSKEKYNELLRHAEELALCFGGYSRSSVPIKTSALSRCFISLPGPVMVKLLVESQIFAGIVFSRYCDEVNERIIQKMIEAVMGQDMSLEQLKQVLFRFYGQKTNSYFAQCLIDSRYAHSGGLRSGIFIALFELLKTAANTHHNAAKQICSWISDVPVDKAVIGCCSPWKKADLGRQLNASREDFEKMQKKHKGDFLPGYLREYQVDACNVLKAYDELLKHLSKKAGDEATQTLRQRVDKALLSYPESNEDSSLAVFDPKGTPSLESMDDQTVSLDDLVEAAIAEAKATLDAMYKRSCRNYWKDTEKEEPKPKQEIEASEPDFDQKLLRTVIDTFKP